MVPHEFRHFPEYQEVTGTPPGSQWALMGPSGERGQQASGGAHTPLGSNRIGLGLALSSSSPPPSPFS